LTLARPRRVLAVLCLAEIASMTGFGTWAALLPVVRAQWGLGEAAAGVVSGALLAGYLAATPFLASATDRIDARRVYAASCLLSTAGCLGFARGATGLWSACAFQALIGAGLAGTYMPGLKAMTDRVEPSRQLRLLAWYTSSFGVGSAASIFLAGSIAARTGWRTAFTVAAAGPLLAAALVSGLLAPAAPAARPGQGTLADFRAVLRQRAVVGWILGYAAHCWELFALRSWTVAFLVHAAGGDVRRAAAAAAAIQLLGPPAAIAGNEAALRLGRRRVVRAALMGSAAGALVLGLAFSRPWGIVCAVAAAHYVVVLFDSAALTAGVVAAAEEGRRGATLALHSVSGFAAGSVAPVVLGAVLQSSGGVGQGPAWLAALGSLSVVSLGGYLVLGRWSDGG
jgi:predicted MFS family arabinose efflux permease